MALNTLIIKAASCLSGRIDTSRVFVCLFLFLQSEGLTPVLGNRVGFFSLFIAGICRGWCPWALWGLANKELLCCQLPIGGNF